MHRLSLLIIGFCLSAQAWAGQNNGGAPADNKEKPVYKTPEQWQKERGSRNFSGAMEQSRARQELAQAQKELDEAQAAFAQATEKFKKSIGMVAKP